MNIKRFLVLFLALCMAASCAFADAKESVLDWLSQAWDDVAGAWDGASEWIDDAWGGASEWIGEAWNDSAGWAKEIWGDVSEWATDKMGSADEWLIDAFDAVTDTAGSAWEWIDKTAGDVYPLLEETYGEITRSAQDGFSGAGETVTALWQELLKKLNLEDGDISKVLDSIKAYAEEKGITPAALEELLTPYLAKLTADSRELGNGQLPAITITQYLTGIAEKIGIETEGQVDRLLEELGGILNAD